jgi:site-specific recombinase XerD
MLGVDIRTVAQLMGHRTIHMTMRYAHLVIVDGKLYLRKYKQNKCLR